MTPKEILEESKKSYKDYCEKVSMELVDPSEYLENLTIKLLEGIMKDVSEFDEHKDQEMYVIYLQSQLSDIKKE